MTAPHRPALTRRTFLRSATAALAGAGLAATTRVSSTRAAESRAAAVLARQGGPSLTFVDPFEPKSYADESIFVIREGIAEGLVRVNFESQYEGALATDWFTQDAQAWHFNLRSGVYFQNGVPMDAGAVAFGLQRLAERRNAPAAYRGARVTADTDSSVTITLQAPVPYLPAILADSRAVIYEPSSSFDAEGNVATPVGTGPFQLVDFQPGSHRLLQAHPDYWGGAPRLGEVRYLIIPQGQTRANMIRTGEADIARVINPPDLFGLQGTRDVQIHTVPLPRVRLFWMNMQRGPTADLRVRQAIAQAVDRQAIITAVLENQGEPIAGLFRPDYPWGNPGLTGLTYDPDGARALLAEAGYGPGNPASVTISTYPSRPELPLLAQVLQQQLAGIGLACDINVHADDVVMSSAALRGELDIVLIARNALFLFDPQAAFETDYLSTGTYNLSRYSGLDDQIQAAGWMTDDASRFAAYRQMEQQIIEQDVAAVALTSYVQIDATRSRVSGYRPHPTDFIALHEHIARA